MLKKTGHTIFTQITKCTEKKVNITYLLFGVVIKFGTGLHMNKRGHFAVDPAEIERFTRNCAMTIQKRTRV